MKKTVYLKWASFLGPIVVACAVDDTSGRADDPTSVTTDTSVGATSSSSATTPTGASATTESSVADPTASPTAPGSASTTSSTAESAAPSAGTSSASTGSETTSSASDTSATTPSTSSSTDLSTSSGSDSSSTTTETDSASSATGQTTTTVPSDTGTTTDPPDPQTAVVYVGGYNNGNGSYPLQAYNLDKQTGALTQLGLAFDAGSNPSYLAVSGRTLYAANERDDAQGGLTALHIADDGSLSPLNHQSGSDGGFTFVAVHPLGEFAFGASYNGGSVSVFPINTDGSLGAERDNVDFGANAQSHCVGFDSTGEHVLVPNKGNNEIAQLVMAADGTLSPNTPAQVTAANGAGPRHIAFSPIGNFAWVMNELNSTLTPYAVSGNGTLTAGTSVSTLPANSNGQNTGAHVEVSPDGRFVYGSNRGNNSIVVFQVDATTGALTLVEHEPTRGSTPRDFDVDPKGDVLIVANQDSATLAVFAIQPDGSLEPLGEPISGPPSPSAVQIVYLP